METTVQIPYGHETLTLTVPNDRLSGVLHSGLGSYQSGCTEMALVAAALASPIECETLAQLARGKERVVILSSDHTRPVPSRLLMPLILREIRRGNPEAKITILVATGCHRASTHAELEDKYGKQIVAEEQIEIHDCDNEKQLCDLGDLPSGNRLWINRTAAQADLLVAEGFIEPHFFAGFSGGRKAVLPGVAGRQSILFNHCADHIAHARSRTGLLEQNPIHEDMCAASERVGLAFILNVVLNAQKQVIGAFAGHPVHAHAQGVTFLNKLCRVPAKAADIVVASNGGFPLDQNIYQSVKGMSTALQCCRPGGIIIMVSRCEDGHGGEAFFHDFASQPDNALFLNRICMRGPLETAPDQWQSQIFLQVLTQCQVFFVSDAPREMVEALHMTWQPSLKHALDNALAQMGEQAQVAVIPDAVSTIIEAMQ